MSKLAPTATPMSKPVKISHDKIAMRAYEKWVERGCQHGRHMQDWLEAERELAAEQSRPNNVTVARR